MINISIVGLYNQVDTALWRENRDVTCEVTQFQIWCNLEQRLINPHTYCFRTDFAESMHILVESY